MPATKRQMRAAGREMKMRREGEATQEDIVGRGTRPFGAASEKTLKAYASWPVPDEQREAARKERRMREDRTYMYAEPTRAFGKASIQEIEFFINASDDEIRRKNGEIE